jgi:cell division septum initiation protein DivIVA
VDEAAAHTGQVLAEVAALREQLLAVRQELQDARREVAEVKERAAEVQERSFQAGQELQSTETRIGEVDVAVSQASENLIGEMAERVRSVEAEAQESRRQIRAYHESYLGELAEARQRLIELEELAGAARQRFVVFQQDLQEAEESLGAARLDLVTARLEAEQVRRGAEMAGLIAEAPADPVIPEEAPAGQADSLPESTPLFAEEKKKRLGMTVNGEAVVVEVEPNTPAAKAGLKAGDVVLRVDDKPVGNSEDLRSALEQAGPEWEVHLTVGRGPDTEEVKAQLSEAP